MALTNALKFVDQRRQNFDSANQQILVHLWWPIVMGPYNKPPQLHKYH